MSRSGLIGSFWALLLSLCVASGGAGQDAAPGQAAPDSMSSEMQQGMTGMMREMRGMMEGMRGMMDGMSSMMEGMHSMMHSMHGGGMGGGGMMGGDGMAGMQGMGGAGAAAPTCVASEAEAGLAAVVLGAAGELSLSEAQRRRLDEILEATRGDALELLTAEQREALAAAEVLEAPCTVLESASADGHGGGGGHAGHGAAAGN